MALFLGIIYKYIIRFCLVVENRNILEGNALPECVAIYVKIIENLLKKAYLIA